MINVLPPELKEDLCFSRYNVTVLRYLLLLLAVSLLVAGGLWLAGYYAKQQISSANRTLAQRQEDVRQLAAVETEIDSLQAKLETIDRLLVTKTQFSKLLSDLAATIPTGSYINTISLTGDEKQPLTIIMSVPSFDEAALVRNALESSQRLEFVDIQQVSRGERGISVTYVARFTQGQAR